MIDFKKISDLQAQYYGNLFNKNGPGVDAVASGLQIYKDLRYEKLCGVFSNDTAEEISVHDVGFGLGHLQQHLKERYGWRRFLYSGSEVTPAFVEYARQQLQGQFYLRDMSKGQYPEWYDYMIFGGTFYHLAGARPDDYMEYVCRMLKNAYAMCIKGIAFNMITEFVEYRCDDLFYATISKLMQFMVQNLSRFITFSHDYPLYEYTVYVYKPEYVKSLYKHEAFRKYLSEVAVKQNDKI